MRNNQSKNPIFLVLVLLAFPLLGADGGCGGGTEYESPVVVTPAFECSPRTCAGGCCRDDNVCYGGETLDACGSLGTDCETCQALQSCRVESSAKGRECLASKWSVRPVMASIPLLDPDDGAAWDADDSAPDVVVELSCPSGGSTLVVRTSEVSGHMPTWTNGACKATAEDLLKSPMTISVIDVDAFFDDPIFYGSSAFKDEDFSRGWVEIPIAADGTSQLRLEFAGVQ